MLKLSHGKILTSADQGRRVDILNRVLDFLGGITNAAPGRAGRVFQRANFANPRLGILLDLPHLWPAASETKVCRAGIFKGTSFADPAVVALLVVVVLEGVDYVAGDELKVANQALISSLRLILFRCLEWIK